MHRDGSRRLRCGKTAVVSQESGENEEMAAYWARSAAGPRSSASTEFLRFAPSPFGGGCKKSFREVCKAAVRRVKSASGDTCGGCGNPAQQGYVSPAAPLTQVKHILSETAATRGLFQQTDGTENCSPSRSIWHHQRCTRPLPLPFIRFSTSATFTRLKSPPMVCLRQLAATANSSAVFSSS